ncbi:MAG TPA: NUDIX domain-containing protein [Candidatus Paceibacterota bacterium]
MIEPKEREMHRIAVTGIIWKDDPSTALEAGGSARKYLIAKRALHKKAWPGKWTVPGGGMEVDDYMQTEATFANEESPQWYHAAEKTLRREIKEEVGLEVSDINYLLDVAFIRPDGIPAIVLSFYCKYAGGEVTLDEDATEYAWITASQISDYELIQGIDHEIQLVEERLEAR